MQKYANIYFKEKCTKGFKIKTTVWNLYQLSVNYAKRLCQKKCYDLMDECQEYLLERISRNEMSKLKSFKGMSSESTFAYVVINNLIKDFLKTKKTVISYDENTPNVFIDLSVESSEDTVMRKLDEERVAAVLQTLSTEDQLIIKLRYYDEYPVYEIALLFKKTPKQISKKIETIKKRLKKRLKREDFFF